MKNIFLVSTVIVLVSCEISTNDIQDSSSNYMTIDEHGLACNDVFLEIGEEKVDRSTFNYGEEVFFSFNDVTGFDKKDGEIYPGLSVEVTNTKDNSIVLENEDLFPQSKGFSESVILLYSNVTMALPHKNNESYLIKINIWDKNGNGSLNFEMPFDVVENEDLNVKTKGVTYSALYLWNGDDNEYVANDEVSSKDQLLIIYEGLDGFEVTAGLVYPSLSLSLVDDNGEEIIQNDNLFADYTENGMTVEDFNRQLYIDLEFYKDRYDNPLELTTILKDKNSDSKLKLTTQIEVH